MKEVICKAIREHKVIAIARRADPKYIIDTARALYDGGIRLLEITFDQSSPEALLATPEMISALRKEFGSEMFIGAGTVLTTAQAEAAASAGAQFILSAVTSEAVIRRANELGLVSIPGAFTPSELQLAYECGADFVKLFPAGDLGTGYMKAVLAPLSHIPIVAVGGVDENNISNYLAAGAVAAGIGSSLVNNKLVAEKRFSELTKAALAYTTILK